MSTPSSIINICSGVRLDNRYLHTIYFSSKANQLAYFTGKVVKTFSNYTFLRKNWSIKVSGTMEQARTWSYLFFQNGSGKHYFYFINQIEYINDNTVELFLELDVMQTYAFDYTLLRSFVEREHASTDAVGGNIVEEGLELGDLRVLQESDVSLNDLCVLIQSTYDPITTTEENTDTVLAGNFDGVFSGLGIYATNMSNWQALGAKLKLLDEYGKSDGIITMWMYPKALVELTSDYTWTDGKVTKEVNSTGEIFKEVARNEKTSGAYTPRNKKLLTYPFNFLYVTNNSGSAAVYRFERFGDPTAINFKVIGALSPEGQVKIYPLNYNGVQHNYEEGLTMGDFPTCAWNQDTYKLWLAQNQSSQNLGIAMGGLSIAGGFAVGMVNPLAGAGAVVGGASTIASILSQRSDKEVQPPQARGQHSASVGVANNFHNFTIKWKSVGIEYAKIIDDYFDMYGYKTNRVKVPNTCVRSNWTYTKTIGCTIAGNFCTEDKTKIESIFDNGITFWVNGDSIGNYSLNNGTL